ncbi:hypothetical protein NCCP2331_18830 [Sporosarcina sp. NCCP-2331]|nr:hypothetical protein NCCP2331_18830 [Sporosarcina sp. NCCP-2331]GLB55854.1 hypothetical protein NCCP2378_16410 [Sporosarcina sp. NCCP-2378]
MAILVNKHPDLMGTNLQAYRLLAGLKVVAALASAAALVVASAVALVVALAAARV